MVTLPLLRPLFQNWRLSAEFTHWAAHLEMLVMVLLDSPTFHHQVNFPTSYRSRQRDRWSLPDDVFGRTPGSTRTTSWSPMPTVSSTSRASARSVSAPGFRDSATTTTRSRPCPRATPNAATLPARIPGTLAA